MQGQKTRPVLGNYLAQNPHMLDCNVKLTMELFDSQYSPTRTTQEFTSVVRQQQQRASLQSPRVAAVVGAQRSTETLPLAILTAVHRIPQVSASATAASFDDKVLVSVIYRGLVWSSFWSTHFSMCTSCLFQEQFGMFARTVTSTKGEAAAAARYFQSIRSTHIAILFVTVRVVQSNDSSVARYASLNDNLTRLFVVDKGFIRQCFAKSHAGRSKQGGYCDRILCLRFDGYG
jgi:Receptor family ligand binding region